MADRIRKAWEVRVRGYDHPSIVYAATAGKARMDVWRGLDCGDIRVVDISVRRAKWEDRKLPERDPIADEMSTEETHCLLHAFGADQSDPTTAGHRDYFYTRRDDSPLVALSKRGLMTPSAGDQWGEGMTYFVLTPRGKHVARSLTPLYQGGAM